MFFGEQLVKEAVQYTVFDARFLEMRTGFAHAFAAGVMSGLKRMVSTSTQRISCGLKSARSRVQLWQRRVAGRGGIDCGIVASLNVFWLERPSEHSPRRA
jgi:hypothetical protein